MSTAERIVPSPDPRLPGRDAVQRAGAGPPGFLIYLYAVAEDATAAHRLLASRTVPGVAPHEPLFPLEAAGLVAAVSRVPAATFAEEPLNALLTDLSRLAPYAVRHEQAIQALVSAGSALIPTTFGSIFRAPERVVAMLTEQAAALRRSLDRVRGRQEWGLKVFADTPRTLVAATAASAELRRLSDEIAASRPGRAYLLARQRERLLAGEAERLTAAALDAIMGRLAGVSTAARREELPPGRPATPRSRSRPRSSWRWPRPSNSARPPPRWRRPTRPPACAWS